MLIETIRSRATEGKTLSLGEYRAVAIPVFVTLTGSETSGTVNYRVPQNDFLVIRRILPHLAVKDWSAQVGVPAGGPPPPVASTAVGQMKQRAYNTKLDLSVTDDDFKLINGKSITLASLMQDGKQPGIDYRDTPLRIRPGKTLQLRTSLTLADPYMTASANTTEFGIVLVGALVRAKSGR